MYDKLIVVAHPDDESIFGGGELLKESGWKVVCLTNGNHEIRAKEFENAMLQAGSDYEIWNYPDERDGGFPEDKVAKDLTRVLKERNYRKVVTHNLNGEYGHSQHQVLSRILHKLVPNELYVFNSHGPRLSFDLLRKKLNLLHVYKSQKHVIDDLMQEVLHEHVVPYRDSPYYNE